MAEGCTLAQVKGQATRSPIPVHRVDGTTCRSAIAKGRSTTSGGPPLSTLQEPETCPPDRCLVTCRAVVGAGGAYVGAMALNRSRKARAGRRRKRRMDRVEHDLNDEQWTALKVAWVAARTAARSTSRCSVTASWRSPAAGVTRWTTSRRRGAPATPASATKKSPAGCGASGSTSEPSCCATSRSTRRAHCGSARQPKSLPSQIEGCGGRDRPVAACPPDCTCGRGVSGFTHGLLDPSRSPDRAADRHQAVAGGHYAVEVDLRAQFGHGFRHFGPTRRRRNEFECSSGPGKTARIRLQ